MFFINEQTLNISNESNANQTITQKVDVTISADIEEMFEIEMSKFQSEILNELQSLKVSINSPDTNNKSIQSKDIFLKNGFYHGNIEDEKYNDDTGNSFLLLLTDNNVIDYLYVGKMKDGYFNDDSGNAWCISKWDDLYVYYKGSFKNGLPNRKEGDIFITSPSIEFLNDIVNDININGENSLYWENAIR